MNARGVLLSSNHDWKGIDDLRKATDANPNLADAWANLGLAQLDSKKSADGAADDFKETLAVSPNYAVASAGEVFAQVALGKPSDEALRGLKMALDSGSCVAPMLADNATKLAAWSAGTTDNELADEGESPGNTVSRDIGEIIGNRNRQELPQRIKEISEIVSRPENQHDQRLQEMPTRMVETLRKNDPAYADVVAAEINRQREQTRPGSNADTLARTVASSTFDASVRAGGGVKTPIYHGELETEMRAHVPGTVPGNATLSDMRQRYDKAAVLFGLEMAVQKYGPRIACDGSVEWKRMVTKVAAQQGISVQFTDPEMQHALHLLQRLAKPRQRQQERGGR